MITEQSNAIKRQFISTLYFDKRWEKVKLDDEDRQRLENEIQTNPQIGKVIEGTGGLRKMRFALNNTGKSGGLRVLYIDFVVFERIYLVDVYAKGQKDNISPSEKQFYRKLISQFEKELSEVLL